MPVNKVKQPPRLQPKEVMNPDDLCWCESGKSWQDCHKDRSAARKRNLPELLHAALAPIPGYCSHPHAPLDCGSKIIKAHTVQRKGGLAAIADDGHVMSSLASIRNKDKNGGKYVPTKIGIGDASTFEGYCNIHDNAMFESIETGVVQFDKELAFLLSTRAAAMEVFRKRQGLAMLNVSRSVQDCGHSFKEQVEIQQYLHDVGERQVRGLKMLNAHKALYDAAYDDPNRATFKFYAVQFDRVLPFVTCGAFSPYTDLNGESLQSDQYPSLLDTLAFNLTAFHGRSVLTLGWMKSPGPAESFARSFKSTAAANKANLAIILALRSIENSYIDPKWWSGTSSKTREIVIEEINRKDFKFNALSRDLHISASVLNEIGQV